MRRALPLLAAAALLAAPAGAQVKPRPGPGDPRIQTIDYNADQVVELQAAPGYQMTVELAPDEQIESVAVGDSSAWQVTANHRGDHLFVKAALGGIATNMTVVTNVRVYAFELTPLAGSPSEMAYTVRFHYPAAAQASEEPAAAMVVTRYRVSGDKTLRPSAISDDGRHTYIEWPRERALPAVYALRDGGQEALVNGMMRDDVFVIDGISSRLVFRIDKRVARADRLTPRQKS
jgi:type IV secretion system protein VirB9